MTLFRKKSVGTVINECVLSLRTCHTLLIASRRALRKDIRSMMMLVGLPPTALSNIHFNSAISNLMRVRKRLAKLCSSEKIPHHLIDALDDVIVTIPNSKSELRDMSVDDLHKLIESCIRKLTYIRSELEFYNIQP